MEKLILQFMQSKSFFASTGFLLVTSILLLSLSAFMFSNIHSEQHKSRYLVLPEEFVAARAGDTLVVREVPDTLIIDFYNGQKLQSNETMLLLRD